jgi:hypothetical protein
MGRRRRIVVSICMMDEPYVFGMYVTSIKFEAEPVPDGDAADMKTGKFALGIIARRISPV